MSIKKYLDFMNESLEFILESDVVYSTKFRSALNKINHPISKKILDIENKDLPVQSNYFDIPIDKNDTVSFIPDRRAKEILSTDKEVVRFVGDQGGWLTHNLAENGSIFDSLGYVPEGEVYKPQSTDIGQVIKKVVSPTSGKTYAFVKFQNERQGVYNFQKLRAIDNSDQVWSKNRQEIKIGRAIRALLSVSGEKPLDKDIESFVNLYKATIDKLNDKFSLFDVVKGSDISFWYNCNNYYERSGTLGSSCMSSVPARYFSIYVSNPDVCNLVIFKSPDDNDKIIGRSLLWKLKDGKMFMDRIYTINDSDVELFRQFSRENGWYHKENNTNGGETTAIGPDGESYELDVTVMIKKGEYDNYPYLDTLKYYYPSTGTLSTDNNGDCYELESTSGSYVRGETECERCGGEGRVDCYECGGSGSDSCSDCDGSGELECEDCNGSGKDSEGNDCTNCDGGGTIRCNNCDDGSVECPECNGEGRYDCPECS